LKKNSEAWAPPYGGKRSRLFHRPLVPILISFALGIIITQKILVQGRGNPALLLLPLTASTLTFPFLPPRARPWALMLIFFLTGLLLGRESHSSSRLIPLTDLNKTVIIQGTVLEVPRVLDDGTTRFRLWAREAVMGDNTFPLDEDIAVTVYTHGPGLEPGDCIRFPARPRSFRNFNNPGGYDYKGAMRLKGLTCRASVSDGRRIVPMGPGALPFSESLVEKIRRPVRRLFKEELSPRNYDLFRALILGERQGIHQDLRELFNRTGLGHMLAVSGLHIGLVAWAAFFLFKWLISRSYRLTLEIDARKIAALLTVLPVIGYTLLAGFHVSAQRAMIMVLAFLASIVLGREREVWSTLAMAGLIILFLDPNAIFSLSFQLSFLAVTGILYMMPPILNIIRKEGSREQMGKTILARLLAYLWGLAAITVAATVFLLPVTCHYFHRISLVSVPANLTTVPILGLWIIPLGLVSAMISFVSPWAAVLFIHMGAWGLDLMMVLIRFWAGIPWASIWTITPNLFEISLFYSLILCLSLFRGHRWARIGIILTAGLILGDTAYWVYKVRFSRDLEVTFLDVGQGNAALVAFPGGKKMLIDGGGFSRGSFDVGKMVVAPTLWYKKIGRIDYMVLSHPQADHMNGLRFIAKAFDPGEFWYNGDQVQTPAFRELKAIIRAEKIRELLPGDLGEGLDINGARVEVLHPDPRARPATGKDGRWLNNNSLVIRITYRGRSFLFPGDIEEPGEEVLLSNVGERVKSDVLLAPHHGSRTSSSIRFLRMVRPRICVVSSREGGAGNFPHKTVLERLRRMGCRVFMISRSGAVEIIVGEDRLEVKTYLEG